jgi:hypothetical protein
MDDAARIAFFKGLHDAQLERGQKFTDPIRTLVTALSFVFALIGYFCGKFEPPNRLSLFLFGLPVLMAVIFLCLSVFSLARVYFLPRLEDLAPADQWLSHMRSLTVMQPAGATVSPAFAEDLIERYAEAAARNQTANDQVGYAVEAANQFLVAALCAALLSIPAYVYSSQ